MYVLLQSQAKHIAAARKGKLSSAIVVTVHISSQSLAMLRLVALCHTSALVSLLVASVLHELAYTGGPGSGVLATVFFTPSSAHHHVASVGIAVFRASVASR